MIAPDDLEACRAILARGSRSFALASRALPKRLRDPVAAYYAFCRVSDDLVDESADPHAALAALRVRVDRASDGTPEPDPVDRALAYVLGEHGVPRVTIDALLEGYLWDVERRRYETLSDTIAYAARVASSVGVAMAALMGARDRSTLARAADLGIAMQLTNIARDVGEDAARGRIYLPSSWLYEEGLAARPEALTSFAPAIGRVVRRLLDHAELFARRAERGIASLPRDCRAAVRAAAWIYGDIGRVIRARGYDSVSARAFSGGGRKLWLLGSAIAREAIPVRGDGQEDGPLPETAFLVEAAAA